jgi:predicted DNA-binding protein (UPF0251 family)
MMPRPHKRRNIGHCPRSLHFKPQGCRLRALDRVELKLDEVEAIRLADLQGLSQEDVGQQMHVSRATVGRILESARRKVADALTTGKAILIEDSGIDKPMTGDEMPGMDKTGPQGAGSRTGRGLGRCNPNSETTNEQTVAQDDQTRGMGLRRGQAGRGGGGRGRGQGRGPGRGPGKG